MTCIWIMPTVSIKKTSGSHKHTEGHIAFLRVIRNVGLGRACGVTKSSVPDISGTVMNKATHESHLPWEIIVRKNWVNSITNKMCSVQASCMHRLILLCLQKCVKEHLNYKRRSKEHADLVFPKQCWAQALSLALWLLSKCEKMWKCGCLNEELSFRHFTQKLFYDCVHYL